MEPVGLDSVKSDASVLGRNASAAARERWLTPEEIYDLLINHFKYGFVLTEKTPTDPPSAFFVWRAVSEQ